MGVYAPVAQTPKNIVVATDQITSDGLYATYSFFGSDASDGDWESASQTGVYNNTTGLWVDGQVLFFGGGGPYNSTGGYNYLRLPGTQGSVGGQQAWRVRSTSAYYPNEWSPWSDYINFYVVPRPPQPSITAPTSGQILQAGNYSTTITWTASIQSAYEVRVLNSSGGVEWSSGVVVNGGTRSVVATLASLGNKTAQVRVRNDVGGGSLWSNTSGYNNVEGAWTSIAFTAIPTTPTITVPAGGASFYPASQTVTWTAPFQQGYEVRVLNGASVEWTSGDVTSTIKTLSAPFPNVGARTIDVRVRQDGVWSNRQTVSVTRLQAAAPVITAPTAGATFADSTRTVTWTAANQDSYEVRVLNASGGVEWTSGAVANAGTRSITAQVPNMGAQTVDVRVLYGNVWSNRTSVAFTRTIPDAPVITAPANGASFTSNAQTLTWTAALQEGYEIRILDAVGAVEWTSGDVTSVVRTLGLSFPTMGAKTVDIRVRYDGYWSNRTSINVTRAAPGTPVITSPANGATFATVAQTVNWTSTGQQAYELRILHTATGVVEWTSGEVTSAALTRAISFPNLGTKTIDLRVRDQSVWSPRASISVSVSPTPTISSLTGGVVAAANEALVGNHSTPFEGDDYQAAVKSRYRIVGAGTWTDGASQSGSQNFYTYPSNLAVGNYERQVAVSLNATGEWSPWSASGLFTVFVRPPMPAIVVPVANTTVADRVIVEWTAPSQDAYEIQVRNGAVVEWTSGLVVSSPLRQAEVLFPTTGERQVYLRVRNNTLWSNEGPGRNWTTLPLSVVATPVTSLDRVIDPFVASSLGYDTVNITWTPPIPTNWSGYRIVRSRSGYPTTEADGITVHEVLGGTWSEDTGYANLDLPGGWHYYTFFLRSSDGTTWVRVATTDVLIPYDFATTDKLWDTIPEYYKHIRDDSADRSVKNLRINPELYMSNDYTAPNLLLSSFLHLFGIGLDHVRTQIEGVATGYGSNDVHVSRLNLLAKQFGRDLEQAVPAYANRTVVRNLAYLYRKRGTLDGIAELATMTTGWDVEVNLGPNMMLNEDQAALANPEYDRWDAARYYTPGIRVKYGSYVFQNILASSGAAQAPANSGVNNTWWNVVLATDDSTGARTDTGDVSTWQISHNPGGVIWGRTAAAVGVVDPLDALVFQTNALRLTRVDGDGATTITAMSVPTVAAPGQTINAKRMVLETAIPLPVETAHVANKFYLAGSLVRYATFVYEALVDTTALPTVTTAWKKVSLANVAARLRLSVYAHGPFSGTGGTGGRAVTLVVNQYDADGTFISELTGVDSATNSGAVGAAWTRPYYTFTPANNARYLGVGARIAAIGLNEKQYLTKWMLERPEISVSTPSVYSKAREAQVLVKADTINLLANPSFETNTTGWHAGTGTLTQVTTQAYVGTASGSVAASAGGQLYLSNTVSLAVKGGLPYTVQGRARAATTGRQTQITVSWFDAAFAAIGVETYSPYVMDTTTGWTRLVYSVVAPPNAANLTIRYSVFGAAASEVHYFDALALTQSASAPEYFDGSTTTDAVWEGTAHASRSHYYENRLERLPALARALKDTVPIGIGVGAARFGIWTG